MAKTEHKFKNEKEEKSKNKSDKLVSLDKSNASEEKLNFNMIHESNDIADEKGYDHDLHFNTFDDNFNVKKEFLLLDTDEDLMIFLPHESNRHVYSEKAMKFAQSRATLDKDWILLDSESTLHIFLILIS